MSRRKRNRTVKTAKDFASLNIPLRTVRRGDPEISAKERNLYDHRYAQLIDAVLSLPTETLRDQLYHHYEESGAIDPDMPEEARDILIARTVERLISTHRRAEQSETHGPLPISSPALRTYWMAFVLTHADKTGNTTRSKTHFHNPWSSCSINPHNYHPTERGPYTAQLSADGAFPKLNRLWDSRNTPNPEHFNRLFASGTSEESDAYSADAPLLSHPGKTVHLKTLNAYARVMEQTGLLDSIRPSWARSDDPFANQFWHLPSLISMVWAWEALTEQIAHVRHRENTLWQGYYENVIQLSKSQQDRLMKNRITLEGGTYAKFCEVLDDTPPMNPFALPDMFKQQYISLGGEYIRELGCNGAGKTPVSEFNPHELLPDSIQRMRIGRAMSERALHEITRKHGRVITRTRLAQMRTAPQECHPTLEEISILCGVFRIKLSWWLWGITQDYALYRTA